MKDTTVLLDGNGLSIDHIQAIVSTKNTNIALSTKALARNKKYYGYFQKVLDQHEAVIYGVNTGFGPMANRVLPHNELLQVQQNLILSHATGAGSKIPDAFVRAAMVVRLNTLMRGNSLVSQELLEMLCRAINEQFTPYVYEHGAVGTSGDLVQLSHIALGLLGHGMVSFKGKTMTARQGLARMRTSPYTLKAKEGLAMINGTAMMTAVSALGVIKTRKLLKYAVANAGLALEIVQAFSDSIDPELHRLRPHAGQIAIAKMLRDATHGSKLLRNRRDSVRITKIDRVIKLPEVIQQVYSLRCAAQILGPLLESLENTEKVITTEMNSCTDNPLFSPTSKRFLHGGNFHGDYVAVTVDQLKIPLVKSILLSERRTNFFLNENVNKIFPPFLNLATPGLTLGLQGLQFVATSTAAHSQTLAFPHTIHSISTNGDNQDLVSMGTDAALLFHKVIEDAYIVFAIEMISLAQAVDYMHILEKLSPLGKAHYKFIRNSVKVVKEDRVLQPDLQKLIDSL